MTSCLIARAADDTGFDDVIADAGAVPGARTVGGAVGPGTPVAVAVDADALGTVAEALFEPTGGSTAPMLVPPVVAVLGGFAALEGSDTGRVAGGELTRVTRMAMTTAASAMPAPVTKSFTGLLAASPSVRSGRVLASAGDEDALLRPSAGASLALGPWGRGWVRFANS